MAVSRSELMEVLDRWASRLATYSTALKVLLGAVALVFFAGVFLFEAFGWVWILVAVVVVLVIAVATLGYLLCKERRSRKLALALPPTTPAAKSDAPKPTAPLRTSSPRPSRASRSSESIDPKWLASASGLPDELQRLYDQGVQLKKGCTTATTRVMEMINPDPPTDEIDVQAWVNRVDQALEGKAGLRNKFRQEPGSSPWTRLGSPFLTNPLRERLRHKLHSLETIINSLQ